jgi:Ran-binding protein 3
VETGEEHEETVFAGRAKLYSYENKEWHERGAGNIKLNVTRDYDEDEDEDDDDDEDEDDERDDNDNSHSSSDSSAKGAAKSNDDGEKDDDGERDDEDADEAKGEKGAKPPAPRRIRARFILRSDGSQRLVLNCPLTKQTQFGGDGNAPPKGTSIFFHGSLETGGPVPLRLLV